MKKRKNLRRVKDTISFENLILEGGKEVKFFLMV